MLFKCDECYLEAGLQVILQTFIQMSKSWKLYEHALVETQPKGYYIQGEIEGKALKVSSWTL